MSAALVVVGNLLMSSGAHAHGRSPETYQVLVDPADSARIAVANSFGLALSSNGGQTWRWVCRQALQVALIEDPPFVFANNGSLVGAVFDGIIRSESDGCEWTFPASDLERVVVTDVKRNPNGELFAVQSSGGGVPNGLYRADATGTTWTAVTPEVDTILLEDIAIAPSQPTRVYLNAVRPRIVEEDVRTAFVYRSDDGGETFSKMEFSFGADERNTELLAVSPVSPDTVYMRVVASGDAPTKFDRLVRSEDGGETWTTLLEVPNLQGFAISDNGDELWVAGQRRPALPGMDGQPVPLPQGLWHSDDSGETFAHIDTNLSLSCLNLDRDVLWACASDAADGFAVGRSTDGGETFEAVMRYVDLAGPVECAESDPTKQACESEDRDIAFDFALPGTPDCIDRMGLVICRDGGVSVGDTGTPGPDADAGPRMDGGIEPPADGGCCQASGATRGSIVLLLLTFAFRRRAYHHA